MSRTASDIGAGLTPARPARPIRSGERVHVVGVAGAGASAAALLAAAAGAEVSGCDPGGPSPYTAALEASGVPLEWRHDRRHLAHWRPERLAVTKALTAVAPDHPELVAAQAAAIALEPWQQLVADVAATTGQRLVAIAGTHGKSTTATWLVHVLALAGRDPTAFVGALLQPAIAGTIGRGRPATARWGRGADFVVEADEYAGNFDPFHPAVATLVSVDWDHPDVFADQEAVVAAFAGWLEAAGGADGSPGPVLVANLGNAGVRAVIEHAWPHVQRVVGFGLVGGDGVDEEPAIAATIESVSPAGTRVAIRGLAPRPTRVELRVAGRHNAVNALAVAATAAVLGLTGDEIGAGLEAFTGASRRLELKGEPGGVAVLDDYGHHPTAIAATLAAARQRYPGRRLWAVYEPLTYHRTAAMLGHFADVLSEADRVVIADIWAGRDPDTSVTSAGALADEVNRRRHGLAEATGSVEETAGRLSAEVRAGDVVVVMGGGRSYRIAELLVAALAEGAGTTARGRRAPTNRP